MRRLITPLALVAALALSATFAHAAAKPGEQAPPISLQDTDGKTHNLAEHNGKIVVLEWINPDCPYVVRHYNLKTMTNLAEANSDVVWLAVATGDTAKADKLNEFKQKHNIPYPILLDKEGKAAKAYGVRTTPHMYIIDKSGKLAYAGAIDSDAEGDPSAPMKDGTENYVAKALSEVNAGTSVTTPQTKAYGCSVKYPK